MFLYFPYTLYSLSLATVLVSRSQRLDGQRGQVSKCRLSHGRVGVAISIGIGGQPSFRLFVFVFFCRTQLMICQLHNITSHCPEFWSRRPSIDRSVSSTLATSRSPVPHLIH